MRRSGLSGSSAIITGAGSATGQAAARLFAAAGAFITLIDSDGERVHAVIAPYIRRTPIVEVDGAEFGIAGARLILKLELLQHSGSFKPRGAFANMLTREVPAAGVVAASGGNHGAAVAYVARQLGKPARIFVPTVCSPSKMERIRGYGAELVITGERYADALAASQEWAKKSGAREVHAYDQVETLLGQGSVGLEFEEQYPGLDSLLVIGTCQEMPQRERGCRIAGHVYQADCCRLCDAGRIRVDHGAHDLGRGVNWIGKTRPPIRIQTRRKSGRHDCAASVSRELHFSLAHGQHAESRGVDGARVRAGEAGWMARH